MILPRASREYATITVTADVNLAPATILVSIDGGAFAPWEWSTTSTGSAPEWTRSARQLVAGPEATPGTALVLTLGRKTVRWRLTGIDPEQPVRSAEPIDVR